jgi:hypothetical protein
MAVHRRPPVEGPPAELVVFRGDDWISGLRIGGICCHDPYSADGFDRLDYAA